MSGPSDALCISKTDAPFWASTKLTINISIRKVSRMATVIVFKYDFAFISQGHWYSVQGRGSMAPIIKHRDDLLDRPVSENMDTQQPFNLATITVQPFSSISFSLYLNLLGIVKFCLPRFLFFYFLFFYQVSFAQNNEIIVMFFGKNVFHIIVYVERIEEFGRVKRLFIPDNFAVNLVILQCKEICIKINRTQ